MAKVGIRELKSRLSYYIDCAKRGEQVTVTDRGQPVVVIVSAKEGKMERQMMELVVDGFAFWDGGKPSGAPRLVSAKGKPLSRIVLEDRR